MTEPVVKIPLSLAKRISDAHFMHDCLSYYDSEELDNCIEAAEREASLDKLTTIGQSMGEYEK